MNLESYTHISALAGIKSAMYLCSVIRNKGVTHQIRLKLSKGKVIHTVKLQAVDWSTIQFCATNRGLLYRRATIQFLHFFGVLLTKTC